MGYLLRCSPLIARRLLMTSSARQAARMALCALSAHPPSFSSPTIINHRFFHTSQDLRDHVDSLNNSPKKELGSSSSPNSYYNIPRRTKQKITSAEDAVSLIRNGDTVAVSGFVCQGTPEAVLKALGQRYEAEGAPYDLTLFFGGGPGDWATRGLNHLAKKGGTKNMLKRTIGSHYGQVPMVADMALAEECEAWALPMGSISRMLRAKATHSPGHITTVGTGTFVDPDMVGGACNEAAKNSVFQPVTKIDVDGHQNLLYKALPINVAIIRGTTADLAGNITIERESLMCDQMNTAMAARNSGGIVIAQVMRLAKNGSLNPKQVAVPGPLVDCVVVVDENDQDELHSMSFVERHNPSLTGQVRSPEDQIAPLPMSLRKVIARRAFFELKPDNVVNLGIGLPEGVARVAAEEDMMDFITLSTEPGIFGGLPASGHSFGPAYNAAAVIEMNQMFDFYDGGGLDISFLGAAQISPRGDVNVSRMSKDRLTGPGGFIDISQSTNVVMFMSPLTAGGLDVSTTEKGDLKVNQEGKIKKFVNVVGETTFSGDEAVRRGQKVLYVTERAVFRRTLKYPVLELIEIAPGVDLQKDILDQLEFEPVVSPNLKLMDRRIFMDKKMNAATEIFGSFKNRFSYHADDNVMFLNLFGISLNTEDDLSWFFGCLRETLNEVKKEHGKMNMVINYDGLNLTSNLEEKYWQMTNAIADDFYLNVRRFAGGAFHHAQLGKKLDTLDTDKLFRDFDKNGNGTIDATELREGFKKAFNLRVTQKQIDQIFHEKQGIQKGRFAEAVKELLESAGKT